MFEVVIGILVVLWLFYKWWTINYSYWKNKGVPYLEPSFPYGNCVGLVKMNEYSGYAVEKIYKEMADKNYVGIYLMRRPHLILKDPATIKNIMLKDFAHFTDRINADNVNDNEPLSHNLFNLGGDKWKGFRVRLTPTFSSGKLKLMFPYFEACSRSLEETIDKLLNESHEIEIKDLMSRYTTKILGTCAYGIDIDSLEDRDNEFFQITTEIFPKDVPLIRFLLIWSQLLLPGIESYFTFKIFPKKIESFLTNVVLDTINYRKNTGFKRNDFIDLLMEIREQGDIKVDKSFIDSTPKTIGITDVDLMAQVFVFLAAGYETSSSVTTYCLYELAENPDIQEKLRKEIQAGQPISYQSIQEMNYLDMVVHETMRKYPTLPFLTRKCTKKYTMPDGCIIDKGIRVIIPLYPLHHDPKYFPEPDKFDPERFTSENKSSRPQFTYMPFGEGPRLCIGMRFGLLQTKMGIATIISKYRVFKTPNTISPLEFVASPLISLVGHPIKLGLERLE